MLAHMARKPRLHVPGGLYHVMLRGNGGQDIFVDEQDRYHLYLLLGGARPENISPVSELFTSTNRGESCGGDIAEKSVQ